MFAAAGLFLTVIGFLRILPGFGIISTLFSVVGSAISFAVGVFTALPTWAKRAIVYAVVLAAVFGFGYHRGHQSNEDAAAAVQARWDASAAEVAATLDKLRRDAVAKANQAFPTVTPADRASDSAIPPRGVPCVTRDPFDRSCAGRL